MALDADILVDFKAETHALLDELTAVVETLEEASGEFPGRELAEFAQKIDRIMGAAQTLAQLDPGNVGLLRIGAIAQLCKRLGYTAAQAKAVTLVPLFAAFWADVLDTLGELVDTLDDEAKNRALASSFGTVLENRLTWLGGKLQSQGQSGDLRSQLDIDKIMKEFAK